MGFLKIFKHDALGQVGNVVVGNFLITLTILAVCFSSQSAEETTMLTLSYTLFFVLGAFLLIAISVGAIKNLNALFSKRGVLSFSLPVSLESLLLPKILLPMVFLFSVCSGLWRACVWAILFLTRNLACCLSCTPL